MKRSSLFVFVSLGRCLRARLLLPLFFASLLSVSAAGAQETDAKPLRALLITGGCCHDYERQKKILTEGISARANVTWDVVHEGGNSTRHKLSIHEDPNWAEGYDVVVHNECFADVRDEAFVENILRPHREGVPAVVIHCAMHSYRIEGDEWFQFVGVRSHRHEGHRPFEMVNLQPEHAVMKGFPETWRTPKGELYEIAALGPNTTPLAQAYGQDTKKDHVCVWTSTYGEGRVFGTTVGHHNETMEAEEYLDMVARGLLWAANKLSPEGKPLDGYGPRAEKANGKKVVFVAGTPSHGYAAHEHRAGCLLLARQIEEANLGIETSVYTNGWPKDPKAFDGADAILVYSNGGGGHPILPHLEEVDRLMKKGVSLLCIHYAVEVPKGDPGEYFLDWIGGYFETHWSVNPHWTLQQTEVAPDHPIGRGVEPYAIYDEWYYHMRFRENMDGVTAILTAVPPESTLARPDGPHSGNRHVRAKKGEPQHVVWARERADGGRGFGFTGGHDHWNWGHPDHRTLVLNAIAWAAGVEVPPGGVPSKDPTLEELEANQDYPQPENFDRERMRKKLEEWKRQ